MNFVKLQKYHMIKMKKWT